MSVAVQTSAERTIAPPGRWTVDARHSAISFTAKNSRFAPATGEFREFEGELDVDDDGDVRAYGTIKVVSLDTGVPQGNRRLLSPDFRPNDRLAEIAYQWQFRPKTTLDARVRERRELEHPFATRDRVDRDLYVRVTHKF